MDGTDTTRLDGIGRLDTFEEVIEPHVFSPLPDDWVVGVTDVIGSTEAIANGRYKAVNMAGASAISALMNALRTRHFAFAFSGDGCAFALPAADEPTAREALRQTAAWVRDDLNLALRIALMPVAALRAEAVDVRAALFSPTPHVAYALFDGGGVALAEAWMKAGKHTLEPAGPGMRPDISGLSCRWLPIRATRGTVLSVIVRPALAGGGADAPNPGPRLPPSRPSDEGTESAERGATGAARPDASASGAARSVRQGTSSDFRAELRDILMLVAQAGPSHPVPPEGPPHAFLSPGVRLEALASRGARSLWRRMVAVFAHSLMGFAFFALRLRAGAFDAPVYRRLAGENADVRKFGDGLMLTLDASPELEAALSSHLAERAAAGALRYGLHRQDAALMTCIVPSYQDDGHFHFIDGAGGGYTAAARAFAGD